jgi:hypothetical protein
MPNYSNILKSNIGYASGNLNYFLGAESRIRVNYYNIPFDKDQHFKQSNFMVSFQFSIEGNIEGNKDNIFPGASISMGQQLSSYKNMHGFYDFGMSIKKLPEFYSTQSNFDFCFFNRTSFNLTNNIALQNYIGVENVISNNPSLKLDSQLHFKDILKNSKNIINGFVGVEYQNPNNPFSTISGVNPKVGVVLQFR